MALKVSQERKMSLFYMQNIQVYINIYIETLLRVYRSLTSNVGKYEELKSITSALKKSGINKGQWGYLCSRDVYPLLKLLDRYQITKLCDLGSGVGIFLKALKEFSWFDLEVVGYEIEPLFVDIAKKYFEINTIEKDVMSLRPEDISEFDALYVYEPYSDEILRKYFFDNLLDVMKPEQFLFYRPSSSHHLNLMVDKRLAIVEDNINYYVFKKKMM